MWWLCDIILNTLPNSGYDGPGGDDPWLDTHPEAIMSGFLQSVNSDFDNNKMDPRAKLAFESIGKTLEFLSAMTGDQISDIMAMN